MRILLDTNVLARAAADRSGPAREVLTTALQDENTLCLSPFLLSELSRVLRYERLRRLHGMDDNLIDQFLLELQRGCYLVDVPQDAVHAVTNDPDDDPIVAAAVVAKVQVLCTLDQHLLDGSVRKYCKSHGIEVLTDVEFLRQWKQA